MRIAYLECFSGISGDMFLGALVDAGVPAEVLERAVAALEVGAELRIRKVDRSGITATKVDVVVAGEVDAPREMVAVGDREEHQVHSSRSMGSNDAEVCLANAWVAAAAAVAGEIVDPADVLG